jgi:hypothetical protein
MKLLILTTDFPPFIGGVSTFTFNIATGLQQVGCRLKIVTSVGSDRSEGSAAPRLRTFHLQERATRQNISYAVDSRGDRSVGDPQITWNTLRRCYPRVRDSCGTASIYSPRTNDARPA